MESATAGREGDLERLLIEPAQRLELCVRSGRHFPAAAQQTRPDDTDPRAYTDRLNDLFTPSGWTREYTISTVPSLCRMERGKSIVTSKVLVATAVTINKLGSHTGTGEEWADRENAVTAADAQAFKRACSCFGLGRYLYRFGETRVRLNSRGEPIAIPTLPEWALPPGMTMAQANGLVGDTRGPVDQRLTAEIEGFRGTLGESIYAEILRRAGHSADARTIPNAERQKQTIEKMQAAARGFERLRHLAEMAGDAQFFAVTERFKIASVTELPSLAALKQLVEDLESLANQQGWTRWPSAWGSSRTTCWTDGWTPWSCPSSSTAAGRMC